MRRTVITKEEPAVQFSVPPQERESVEDTERSVASTDSAQHEEKVAAKAARKPAGGRVLRGAIVLFSALGLFTLLVPTLTGVPLNEWLGSANFQAAYSGDNLKFMRGSAALNMGNLAGATDVILSLPPESTEAKDLAAAIFPRLMEAGDYVRAARICQHLLPATQTENNITASLGELGKHMVEREGLERALALVKNEPGLSAQSEHLIPAIFEVMVGSTQIDRSQASKTVPESVLQIEKLFPTLSGLSRTEAAKAVATIYSNANNPALAWEWTLKLPETIEKSKLQKSILDRYTVMRPEFTLNLLKTLGTGAQQDVLRVGVLEGIAMSHPVEAQRLLASVQSRTQRDRALKALVSTHSISLKERLAYLDQIRDLTLKLEGLVFLNLQLPAPAVEQLAQPKLTAFVRQHPEFTKTHDELLRYLAVRANDPKREERFLNAMLDPATRAATQKERKEGLLNEASFLWENGQAIVSRQQTRNP